MGGSTTASQSSSSAGFSTLLAGPGGLPPPSGSAPFTGPAPPSSPPLYPTGTAGSNQFAYGSGAPKKLVRPNHKLFGTAASNGFPRATLTAGTGVSASGVFPSSSGTGSRGGSLAGTGVQNGVYPSGTGGGLAGTGFKKGIFFQSGTNPRLTASGGANATVPTRAASCGLCDVIIPQVQVQYFPNGPQSNGSCTANGAGPSITPPPAASLVERRLARRNGTFGAFEEKEEIAVSDGYTFTAPNMYVVMSQGIHVTDLCGTIGSSFTSAVVPVSSGALKSVSYNIAVGETLTTAVMHATSYTKPVRPEDLACPTWGISGNWNPRPDADPLNIPGGIVLDVPSAAAPGATSLAVIGVVKEDTVVGPPWYPILVLPHEVLGLDALWQQCEGKLINPSFPIFDPPHSLSGETVLVSTSAPAYAQAVVTTSPIIVPKPPGGGGKEVVINPPTTGGVGTMKIAESLLVQPSPLALAPAAPTTAAAPAQVSAAAPPASAAAPPVSAVADTDPQITTAAPVIPPPVLMSSLNAALAVSTVNVEPVQANVVNNPAQSTSPANVADPPSADTPTPLSVAGQQVQQAGSTLVVGSQSIAPGSTAAVAGHTVVNNGDNVVVDGSSQAVQPNPTPAPTPLPSVGGQQIQQSGSNLVVAGQTIAPGSTGSVAGHTVVNDGKNVVVDGSSQPIQPNPAPTAAALPSVGGQPVVKSGKNLVVAGQTIAPGSTGSVAGHAVVNDNNGNDVVVDGSTQPVQPAPTLAPVLVGGNSATGLAPAFQGEGGNTAAVPLPSVGGQQIQQQGSNLVVGGQTITPGASATIDGHQVINSGSALVVDGSTQALPSTAGIAPNSPPQGQPPLTIDGSTYLPTGPSSAYILPGGQTLTPGAQVTVAGTPVSLAPDGSVAVVGGSTENLSPTITPPPGLPAITFAGSTFRPVGASSSYVVDGQTLTPGGSPITVSGTPISLYSNGATAVVGSSTENLQPPVTSAPGLTFDGTTYQPTNIGSISSAYIVNGQTITPGAGPVTISGTPISVASDGNTAVVGGVTEDLGPSAAPEPALTFDGSTIHPMTGAPSDYVINGQTLTPGGQITVSGTPISLATDAASAVIGSSTENLQMTEPPLVFGGSTYYPTGASSAYVVDGQTITRGASLTISGTPISLASDGASAVVGTTTEDLLPSLTSGAVLTVGGQTFTPNPSSFIMGGKTMTVGGSAIISGTPVALEPSGTLMVGTSEIPLATSSGKLVAPSNSPITGSAAGGRRRTWPGVTMGLVGFGILYIIQNVNSF